MSAWRVTAAATSARFEAPSLRKARARWAWTVRLETNSRSPISRLVIVALTGCIAQATFRSRHESLGHPSGQTSSDAVTRTQPARMTADTVRLVNILYSAAGSPPQAASSLTIFIATARASAVLAQSSRARTPPPPADAFVHSLLPIAVSVYNFTASRERDLRGS